MKPTIISGGQHTDQRGTLRFVNDFDMSQVVRLYSIHHPNVDTIRAWQGHQVEQKWFYCTRGSFIINLIKVDDWEVATLDERKMEQYILKADEPTVLHIPGGYVNGFRALEKDSTLTVYSDMTTEQSQLDDYRYPMDNLMANPNLFE